MKKYFTTGLAILLPIVFTMIIVGFFINLLTAPFLHAMTAFLSDRLLFHSSHFLFHHQALISLLSKTAILSILFLTIILVGWLGELFLIDSLVKIGNRFIHRLPFVNKIYKTCQEIVQTIFSSPAAFSQVVFVPFPNEHNLTLGFVTGHTIEWMHNEETKNFISVFVPGTPNPTVGFMLLLKREQVTFLQMKVEDAMKFIISCGVVMPEFSILQSPSPMEKTRCTEQLV